MDSFFAAADNLDNLLDELEENEEDSSAGHTAITNGSAAVVHKPSTDSTPTSIQNNLTMMCATKPIPAAETSVLIDLPGPYISLDEAHTRNILKATSTPNCAPINVTFAESEASNLKPEASLVSKEFQNSGDSMSRLTDFSTKNVPPGISVNSQYTEALQAKEPELPQSDFVVIDSDAVTDALPGNADVLLELFGVGPTSQALSTEAYVPESQILSPLNPFSSSFVETSTDDVPQAPNTSGIFHSERVNGEKDFLQPTPLNMNKTNPFLMDQAEIIPDTAQTANGSANNEFPPANQSPPPMHVDTVANFSDHTTNEMTRNISMVNTEKTLKEPEEEYFSPDSSTLPIADLDQNLLPKESQNLHVLESFPAPKNLPATGAVSSPEKQETSSVGFMRDVVASEEEFERFMAKMEADESGGPTSVMVKMEADESGGPTSDSAVSSKVIRTTDVSVQNQPSGSSAQDAFKMDAAPLISAVTVSDDAEGATVDASGLASEQFVDEDMILASAIPPDALISESEFEQFLSTEIDASANAEIDVSPETLVSASSTHELIIPAAQSDRDGSPTFLLPPNVPPQVQVTVPAEDPPSPQPAAEQRSNNTLSLNVGERTAETVEAASGYPVTPPPPYTEEMHANYERSRSPPPQTLTPSQQSTEQGLQEVNEILPEQSQNIEDVNDILHLPSAVLEIIERPGETKPTWVPDENSPQCNNCASKFTFTKRRHHCRACGKLFCAQCCSEKCQLKYLEYKEARVCLMCSLAIKQADALAEMQQRSVRSQSTQPSAALLAPAATTEEGEKATADAPDPPGRETQPRVDDTGELVQESTLEASRQQPQEDLVIPSEADMEVEGAMARMPSTKSVRFSDGTRPTHPDEMPSTPPPPSRVNRSKRKLLKDADGVEISELPPVIIAHGEDGAYAVQENPDSNVILSLLESGDQNPQSFVLNPNLILHVKIVSHAHRQCWCCWSEGMDSVGQREIVLLLEREGLGDRRIASDAFTFYRSVFDRARKGKVFNTADFMPKTMLGVEDEEPLFGVERNAGFMFVQATSQALDGLTCLKRKVVQFADGCGSPASNASPVRSMLFAIVIQKNEAPWATLFPMRLMLRLGMETKQYPCPLFSVRRRDPVFYELGHTILAILCDFRNFKYRVISVPGLRVVVGTGGVSVQIPCNRFGDTVRIMNSSNESVLAIGTGMYGPKSSTQDDDIPCESHLVCVQDQETSSYRTELLTMKGTSAMNTGAAFVIFNGSLKSDSSYSAKCAIVEDGIMIQLLREKMEELRASLKSMEDFHVEMAEPSQLPAGNSEQPQSPPTLEVKWVDDDTAFNIGMFSPIDGTPFEGVIGFNVQGKSEQRGKRHVLRWNQVFFLASTSDPLDMSRLAEQVANGCFLALTPVLQELARHRQHKVAVRVTIHPENVGYVAGSGLRDLPLACMNALDEHLIQTIHSAANSVAVEQEAVVIELLFSILLSRPSYRTV